MAQMIIANRLTDGRVVFFVSPGKWVIDIDEGTLIDDEPENASLLESAKQDEADCLVVDPNLIEVETVGRRRRPTAIREAIRAFGPSPEARTDKHADNRE
jgi:hypothetical protein